MPRVMTVVFDMEIVVTPPATYMLFAHSMPRRIFTDGRDWPAEIEPTFLGLSIGKWLDTDGDGRFDMLEIETRGLKGPRTYEGTGMPFHADNETVVKERLALDKSNPNGLTDEITGDRPCPHPAVDDRQALSPRPRRGAAGIQLLRRQSPRADRRQDISSAATTC